MNWLKKIWLRLSTPVPRSPSVPRSLRYATHPEEAPRSFTPRAQQVLALSRKEADRFNHNFVGTEHLLLGLIALGQGVAVNVLQRLGLELETVRQEVEKQVGTGPEQKMIGNIPYTPRVKKVLAFASNEARALNHTYVGTEHILLGLLREGDGVAARILLNLEVDITATRREILKELDPNYECGEATALTQQSQPSAASEGKSATGDYADKSQPEERFDVYCIERDQQAVVYRNVSFKGAKRIFPESRQPNEVEFYELEHSDGTSVFVSKYSIVKFCKPGVDPKSEPGDGNLP